MVLAIGPVFSQLANEIDDVIERPEFSGCLWGIKAERVGTTEVLYELNADLFFVPASNNKLLSTFAAWNTFGPSYQFHTTLVPSADSSDRVVLCGAGDPSLTSLQVHEAVASAVQGNPTLRGSNITVQIDASRSEATELFPSSWEWGDLQYYYGAAPSAVVIDGNVMTVRVSPGASVADGANVSVISVGAESCFGSIRNEVTTSDTSSLTSKFIIEAGTLVFYVTGSVAADSDPIDLTIACMDPLRRAAAVLTHELEQNNVTVVPSSEEDLLVYGTKECFDNSTVPLADIVSESLAVLLNHTLLESDNTFAEEILRRQSIRGGYTDAITNVTETLCLLGLNTSGFSIVDGSGLSRHDLIKPQFLAALFTIAGQDFVDLLPLAGRTGTLATRFVGTPAEGKLRAKTGTESGVNALSGRVNDVAFSILTNNCPQPSSVVRTGIDDIAVLFAEV